MVKFLILKVDQPNCFLGQDLYIFDKVNSVCEQVRNSNSRILPCSEVIIQKIYLADLFSELVRIRVLNSINTNTFRCLLIDHGKIEEIRKQKIYNIPLNQLDMDPAIKMIKIPGIMPAGMSDVLSGIHISVKLSESDKWMPASYKFVSRIFEEHQVVNVEYLRQLSRDKSYAEVSVIYNNQKENLRDLLIAQGYAFLHKEPELPVETLPNTLSVDIADETDQNGESEAATFDSLENESISSIIGNMTLDEKTMTISSPLILDQPTALRYSTNEVDRNRSVHGGLDELSLQILRLKVKCWFVSRSTQETESGAEEIQYEYKDTIRPITSYKNEPILAKFLKDAMSSYDTKLLLLIQAYMIPTVLRGVNMVAIAPPRKGKSMGLLMPVLQTVAMKQPLPTRSYNPLVVILCSSWKRVKDLAQAAERFVRFIPDSNRIHKPRIVAAYAGSMKKMTMIPILQGCDILIITPTCLLSWLRSHEFFKLNELEMFCLDDAENIIAEHLDVLREILIFKRTGAIDRGSEPGQFITATHWTSGLESYVKHEMGDLFSIAVNDPLELAVIGRMRHNIIEYDDIQGDMYQKLIGYLELTESSIKRTIIFASDDNEIAAVYKYLMQKSRVDLKLMTGSMNTDELNQMVKEWNQYRGYVNMPILLISDEALRTSDISIFNADIILHVDINESSFGNRLNFLRDKYAQLSFLKSKLVTRRPPGEERTTQLCSSFIFLCRKTINLLTANFLYKFLGRCDSTRPGWLQEKAVDFILNKEKSKGYNEICPRIKCVGECKLPGCVKRHMVMTDIDKPQLPNRGHIQFRLLHLESPSHFFVRLSEIKSDAEHNYKSQYLSLKMKMANYFGNPQNICGINLRLVQVGLIAAIKNKDMLERVMVSKMKSNKTGCVLVKLIDKGLEMIVEQAEMLHLPRQLSEIPAQAVEVYVTGIRPLDNDEYYSEESCSFAKEFLEDNDLHAVIKLCIGSTLWIDAVTQRVHHSCTNITVFDMNLSVTLLDKNLVNKNSQHVEKLVRLCTGKIDIWKQEPQDLIKSVPIMRKFSYLNSPPLEFEKLPLLDEDNYLSTECVLGHVVSPNCIFFNNRNTIQSARDLQIQIGSLIDSIENLSVKDTKIGARVIFHENDAWQRGYIVRVDDNEILSVFALDWGTIATVNLGNCPPLKRLPCEYQELPYQAILCGMAYCLHIRNSYSPDVVAAIKHYAIARTGSGKRTSLSVRAYEEQSISGSMFQDDNSDGDPEFDQLDLFESMKRYLVTISNSTLPKADEMLHYVLVRNLDVLPSLGFLHEVLPECHPFASRLVRNGSIPHLTADLMSTKDSEKRIKVGQAIERIIDKKKEIFSTSGVVSNNINSILHSVTILIHFVNERSVFCCIYRALNSLLAVAYEKKLPIDSSTELFSVRYIANILLDYESTVFHMLRHLEILARSGKVEEVRVVLDNFRMLLLEPMTVQVLFEDQLWTRAMATCIGALRADHMAYNLLMDLLVQLVMLCRSGKAGLDDMLSQCCLAFQQAGLDVAVCNSSLSLVSCLVNMPEYAHVFRDTNFFEVVLDRFVELHQREAGRWSEVLDSALDVLINLWRNNGARQRQRLASARQLSRVLEPVSKLHLGNSRLSGFVTDLILEESSLTRDPDGAPLPMVTATIPCSTFAPDADALDWIEKREISSKRQRKSYRRVFGSTGDSDSSSDDRHNSLGNDDDSSSSDSSDFEATPFLHSSINPADEDNVDCFEKA